jgi:penicillin-binding protein 1B
VAIIRGPSWYNPYRHPQRTHQRRDLVLAKMFEAGLIDSEELERNLAAPFQVARGARGGGAYYPAFLDLVRETLSRHYDEADLTGAGLTVFTTLSPRTQDAVERTLHSSLQQLDQQLAVEPHNPLQGAVVVANSQTGEIEALSGGRAMGVDGFNRAINARRPIGSLVKPVIYLAALERGYSLISPTEDAPITLTLRGSEPWSPQNFDGELHGTVPLIRALGDSLNLATVNLGLGIGLDQIATRLQELTGRAPENPYPSLLLGAEPMSPLEVTSLYATFASGGYHLTPKTVITVLDESGAPLTRHPFELDRRIDPERARAMVRALEVVMEQGTGTTSRFAGQGVAGKTGTSDDYRDSWFAGFDARRVAVVWVGFDDNQPTGMTGAGAALKIWDALFARLGLEPLPGPAPDWRQVEYASGLIASEHCAEVVRLPLPAGADARYKSGCGLDLKQMADRIGRKFKEWFE